MNEKASVSLLGNDKSDSDKLDKIANQLYEEGDFIGVWHAETKLNEETSDEEKKATSPSFVPKLKIAWRVGVLNKDTSSGNLTESNQTKDYSNGIDKKDISERRFKITSDGLKEVTNDAPEFEHLEDKEIPRGGEFKPLDGIKEKIKDDFDKFDDDNLETKSVSITYSSYDIKRVGEQTITYTATDKWGRSSTATRKLTVTSENPLDTKYIEFKKNNEGNNGASLFKIKFDPVEKKFLVDNLDAVQEEAIDPTVSSSIFKLKVYTQGGVLQKTLNIKGTDNLKTILKKFDGYTYNVGDRIELWSNNPKNIVIHGVDRVTESNGSTNGTVQSPSPSTPEQGSTGNLPQPPNGGESSGGNQEQASGGTQNGSLGSGNNAEEASEQNVREGNLTQISNSGQSSSTNENDSDNYENYENGIDNSDFMKNVRFELQDTKLVYVYNSAPEIKINDKVNLEFDRNQDITGENLKEELMNGITVTDDHDDGGELLKKVIVGNIDLTTIGEKEVEYRVVDSWGRSSLVKRKVTVYPLNSLEYNYITLRNNETFDPILTIKLNDETKKFVVDKIDRSKIPSSLKDKDKVFELKLIRKKNGNSSTKTSEENSIGKNEKVVDTITLTKEDLMNDEKIKKINELSYEYSDYISLWVYDSEDGIFISGKSDVILNGFEGSRSQEAMQNTRFKIKQTGLESIYNEAPKINGLDKKLYVYKNDDITQKVATRDLEVKDDSGEITLDSIKVTDVDGKIVRPENSESNSKSKFKFKLKSEDSNEEKYIKTDGIREFKLNYKVTDAWGRSATYQRTVSVISRSVSNDIEFYNKEGNKNLFSLKYNPISNIFDVSKKENNSVNNGAGNNPPSEEQPPQDQSPDESEQSLQGTDGELKSKTGNLSEGNNDTVQDNIPNEGNPDQDDNPSVENPPQGDSNNSQGGEGSEGSNDREDNTEQPKKEIVFKLAIFNGEEKKVGEIELTEEETINIEEFKKKLSNITIYDGYYVSVWSNKPERIKIKGYMTGNNELGESENVRIDYSNGTTDKDYIDNVRFNLTEDGIRAVYNKAPKITITSKEMLTAYAGDIIDYTKNIEVKDDRDNEENGHIIDNSKIKVTIIPKKANGEDQPIEGEGSNSNESSNDARVDTYTQEESSTETEEEAFRKEEEKHLKIGKNTIRLTVEDSWGRATSIERNLLILNGIDKNEIIFKAGSGQEPIRIKFNHQTKNLNIITQGGRFGDSSNPGYVKIAVYRPNKNGGRESIVPEISINASETVTEQTLERLKNYNFQYGDYFEIYHGHPQLFSITGGINNQRENYEDGVQNPENLLNVKFEITESGLKSIYTNPDENNISDNKVIFGPVAQEKFPFKIQIDFENRIFKVTEVTGTYIKYGNDNIVYKIALIRKSRNGTTRIERESEFRGSEFAKNIMSMYSTDSNYNRNGKNWNGQRFEYDDCLYLWHDEPNRSIIKGNIKNEREDYSNGVDELDNMNNVVFRLTPTGLESIYNKAPEIKGVEDIDVYQNQEFDVTTGVTYNDDFDNGHLSTTVSADENGLITDNKLDTRSLGEKIITYTATDRWRNTTIVKRKVTVRPNLYKNVFKVFDDSDNISQTIKSGTSIEEDNSSLSIPEEPSIGGSNSDIGDSGNTDSGSDNPEENIPENNTRTPVFEIGFDTITNKYKVYNTIDKKLSSNNMESEAFTIEIRSSDLNQKIKVTLTGNDRGTSPKLLALNNIDYNEGDIISVYRSSLSGIQIVGDVTGHIPSKDDMSNSENKFDYMKNTGFIVKNSGLEAKYNKAPVIDGLEETKIISKGTIDLLNGITVSDDIYTGISKEHLHISVNGELIEHKSDQLDVCNYNFDKVGVYKVEYKLYDSWGRATLKESTINVQSKVRENEIEVYGPNNDLAFRITFDTNKNKFVLKGKNNTENDSSSEESNDQEGTIDTYSDQSNSEKHFEMIVRDAKGNERKKVTLTGEENHDRKQLEALHQFEFNRYDTISLYGKTPEVVKIKGDVVSEVNTKSITTNYSNGFDTVEKYSEVRFKITDDGLREMTKKSLRINGADPITIKRGDTLDLLEGVSVNVNDENNEDYELTVEEITSNGKAVIITDDESDTNDSNQNGITSQDKFKFTKLKEGTYTIKYTVTNSWGATTTVDRKITVDPRTDLEAVKLTVKDYQGEDILVIGFDSIERKLRVLEYKNKSIDYLYNSQVFEINAYDSLGKTLGTIALRGNQTIDQSIIDRINDFNYEEGYSLSVWSKVIENRINIEGTIKVDDSSKEESKKNRYKRNLSAEQKIDKMENGRFEILSDGLKYIYNNAPEITGGKEIVPYYKGNLLKAPESLTINDDHDGEINRTEVTVNDDNVDYDKLGIQPVTYVVEDSWGRRAEKEGQIEIRSAMDSNSINIYPKENSTTGGTTSESTQLPNQSQEGNTQGESAKTRTTEIEAGENGNISEDTNKVPETGDSVEGGTQNPEGSTEGGVESTPEGGNNTSGSGTNGTTIPDSEINKDNSIVTESSFSIKFVRDNEHNKNRIQVDLGSRAKEQFDSNNPTGTFLKVKIYDTDGSELKSVDILGNDTGKSAKEKIENELNKVNSDSESKDETKGEETEQPQTKTTSDIEDSTENSTNSSNGSSQGGSNSTNKNDPKFEYFNGQYIAIEGVTKETKNSVKIQGTVVNKDKDVSYDNGVSDLDKIQNVRFKFTDLGLEAVYNNAPVIKINENIKLDGTERKTNSNIGENLPQDTRTTNKEDFDGIKGDDFNYLRGVTISDDHDILTKENVEVKWNKKFKDDHKNYNNNEESALTDNPDGEYNLAGNGIKVYGQQNVGNNVLYYKVTDSWGRVTYEQRKNIKLKNGAFEDTIKFGNGNNDDKLSLKFNKIENNTDSEGKVQLHLSTKDDDQYFASDDARFKYYEIQVWVPTNNNSSNERASGYEQKNILTLNGNQKPQDVINQIAEFNALTVPYGTILKIYAGHPQLFSIEGPVRDKSEDYSDKVQNPENLINTVFKITEAGLKAIYVEPEIDKLNINENLISLVAPEKIPLKIKIAPSESAGSSSNGGTISIVDSNMTWIDNNLNMVVFEMILKGADGQTKRTISIRGNNNGNDNEVIRQFENLRYVYGDTLTISHRTPKKVLIKGNVINARENYSDGVDNSLNLEEAVFKLTANGLEAVYKSAPQIMGIIDMQVEKGERIDYKILKDSVSAKDNIDGNINKDAIHYGDENINTDKVGMYEFTYTVTNSNQRTTTKSSTITVYDNPTINKNNKATIELNSIENTENAIKDYLKTAVDVSDDDDKLYNKTTKIEVKDNNVNPNEAGTYQATYKATDLYGHSKEETIDIQVVRTINVTVPTKLPFQVVTNLMPSENQDETTENNGFVSGVLKLKNNNTSPVKVSVASFAKKANSGELEIVKPNSYDWNNMTEEESMKKMALGLYIKDNSLNESKYNGSSNPLWLSTNKQNSDTANPDSPSDSQEPSSRTGTTEDSSGDKVNVINKELGKLPAKETGSDTPKEASIGFTSKHGKNFIGGSVTGKFELIFKFE